MNDVWQPRFTDLSESNVAQIQRELGFDSYAALYAYSIAHPDRYWRFMNRWLGVKWRRDYTSYCDLSRGKPFPAWFAGGEINWTDTILSRADDPQFANKLAVIGERESGAATQLTYRELRDVVASVAAGLAARGLRSGDRVGLFMENGVEATVSLLALSYLGAIMVPLFSGFGADPIVSRLNASRARGLIATSGFPRRGRFVATSNINAEVRARVESLDLFVLKRSEGDPETGRSPEGFHAWEDVAAASSHPPHSSAFSADHPFMVIHTSGTTGVPKGVVHTHGGFPLKIAHDSAVHFNVNPGDVFCWPSDMGWIAGSLVLASALMRGATLICYDGAPDFPDWSRMAQIIEKRRITHYGSAPTLIRGFAANAALATKADLSSVRLLITAGEGIAPEHFNWFRRHFGGGEVPVINYTGGTEVSGALLSSVVVLPIAAGGFNAKSPGVAVDIVDAAGATVVGEVGELAVREPFVGMTKSFWQDDERYFDTYWSAIPDVWVHGDLALDDGHGNFFMQGRSDDTIKVAGKRVGPAEVEAVLVEIEGVEEAAVIGADDPTKGQAIIAFLKAPTLKSNRDSEALLIKRVQDRLGKPFGPREIYFVTQLPKTRSSKIMRRVIRCVYNKTQVGDLSSLVNPEAIDEVRNIIEKA